MAQVKYFAVGKQAKYVYFSSTNVKCFEKTPGLSLSLSLNHMIATEALTVNPQ